MGKQSKRKNKKKGGRLHRPTGLAGDPATIAVDATAIGGADNDSPVSKIIKKIRHGDPRVRHAALVALSRTLYDGTSLERNAAKRASPAAPAVSAAVAEANNPTLLQALSEKILDTDVPCATIAVGCLSNYVSFYCVGNDDLMQNDHVASDVMAPILLQRLQSSFSTVSTMMGQLQAAIDEKPSTAAASGKKKGGGADTPTSPTVIIDKQWPSVKEQWELLSLSLITLAGLIENCPKALQRLGANSFPQLITLLPLARSSLEFLSKQNDYSPDKKGDMALPMLDAVTHAMRSLHSLLDDNRSLITSLQLGNSIEELTNAITTRDLPHIAKLHAAGSVLSLRRVLVLEKEMDTKAQIVELTAVALQNCTNNVVLPLLSSVFDTFMNADSSSEHSPSQVLNQMIATSNELSTIKNDANMEEDVVNKVNSRKEPSRDIAKRQKKMKAEKKKRASEDAAMEVQGMNEGKDEKEQEPADIMAVVEDDNSREHENDTKHQQKEDDLQEELDKTVSNWKSIVGSHKLALELVANLCSGIGSNGDDEDPATYQDDDDEHMWDSDDEAKLVADSKAASSDSNNAIITPSEQATYNSMTTPHHQLPEIVLQFFRKWVEFLPNTSTNVPELVSQDVSEVLSTCALCLGNILACNLSTWSSGSEKSGLDLFWSQLVAMLSSSAKTTNPGSNMSQYYAITGVMLSMLQSQPRSRTFVDESTLDGLFALLLHDEDGSGDQALLQTQCNIISILGVLCSEPHPALIDAKVCSALLQRLARSSTMDNNNSSNQASSTKQSVIITHEILNALMDMYGDEDNCHDEVFDKESVLDHIRRCLPGFKRRIKKAQAGGGDEEVHVWNETALNASRFIKYKQ